MKITKLLGIAFFMIFLLDGVFLTVGRILWDTKYKPFLNLMEKFPVLHPISMYGYLAFLPLGFISVWLIEK